MLVDFPGFPLIGETDLFFFFFFGTTAPVHLLQINEMNGSYEEDELFAGFSSDDYVRAKIKQA